MAPGFESVSISSVRNDGGSQDMAELAGVRRRQSMLEYVGSREYRPGMPVRRWDFASWARLGHPAVREFSEGRDSLAVLVVDALRRQPVDESLESVLSRAAAIVDQLALELDQNVVLAVVADRLYLCDTREYPNPFHELMCTLAGVAGAREQTDWPEAWHEVFGRFRTPLQGFSSC